MKQPIFLPISVWYSGGKARAPMLSEITEHSQSEWKHDLEQIKTLGFNTVRTWVEWAHCEPHPGEYSFQNLRMLMELAEEVGLRVFIQMYADSAPDWVGKQYPDAQFEAQSGEKVPSQAAPGYCTDHPDVARAVMNFYTEAASIAVKYPCLYGWDLWSEPHIINWAIIKYVPDAQFCYCPYSQAAFREWLKHKYGSIECLNKRWYRNFTEWEEVTPPRFGTILSYTDYIDWKLFIMEKLASDLRMRYEAIRKSDPSHVITSHAAVPSLFTTPQWGDGTPDDFLMADMVDYYGTSLYPKHSFPDHHWPPIYFHSMGDFTRSANIQHNGFYVGELQAGYGTRGIVVGDPVTAGDHRTWLWSALAKGARGVHFFAYYPMSSGYESGGYGLIHLDGALTERAQDSGAIADVVTRHQDIFLDSQPAQAEVALVYNPLAQMVGGEQHSGPQMALRDSLLGYYRVFMEHNIPVDFIHRRDLEMNYVSHYKLVILPYPIMLTEAAARGLQRYVASGGCAVAEARLAWNNESGCAAEQIPGMGLDEVFGVKECIVKMQDSCEIVPVRTVKHPALARLAENDVLKGSYFCEGLEPANSSANVDILAHWNNDIPIVTACNHGKGQAILIGSFLGMAYFKQRHAANESFILGMLDWAKIERPLTTNHDGQPDLPVEVRIHEGSHGYILFIINHSEKEHDISVQIKNRHNASWVCTDVIQDITVSIESKDNILEMNIIVPAKDALVYVLKKSE